MNTRTLRRAMLSASALIAAASLAACSAAETAPAESAPATQNSAAEGQFFDLLPESVQDAGVLTIGVSPNFPPSQFTQDGGSLDGFEIQLARAVGPYLGVEIEHVTTNFAGLQADRFDVVLSGVSDTLEREAEATFVNYLATGTNFMVKAGNPLEIETTQDLCGLTAGETIGTSYIDMVTGYSDECEAAGEEPIEVQTFQTGTEIPQAIVTDRIDFSVGGVVASNYYAKQSDGAVEAVGELLNPQHTGFVVPRGEDDLVDALQQAMQAMIDDGSMDTLMSEWGVEDQVLEEIQVNGASS